MKKKHKVTDRVWDRERDRDLEREGEEAREREQGVWAGDASSSFAILLKREKVMGMGHTLARLQRESYLKKVNAAIESGDQAAAQEAYTSAVSVLDKATRKGKYHPNKAARHKSRLNAKIKALAA